jgi:hypothetical protein
MNDTETKFDFEAALRDPAAIFREPKNIVALSTLSRERKLALLRRWEREARALSVAEEEGMIGGEPSMLSRVRLALQSLGGDAEGSDAGVPDKHGGQID